MYYSVYGSLQIAAKKSLTSTNFHVEMGPFDSLLVLINLI